MTPMGAQWADKLLQYFEGVNWQDPGDHWRDGAEMCRRWLCLLSAEDVSQRDVDTFIARLRMEPNRGTGWIELDIQFRHWARSRGFAA